MKNFVALILMSAFAASGCTTIIDPIPARVVITDDGGGKHCPPGQAKKGRC